MSSEDEQWTRSITNSSSSIALCPELGKNTGINSHEIYNSQDMEAT